MAAVASDTVNITINDVEIQVPKGELIVEAVKRLGLEIPVFCYHPRMKPVGMCRMCIVEVGFKQADGSVRKMPKPQAACTLPAQDNLVIYTDSEMVHTDRRGVLEFLLINHPLDCPICDRGGECPLQNNTIFYGPSTSRFVELKRHADKAIPLSKHVTLDLERCIQCGRCVRFTEEISGDSQLAFRFRGSDMQPCTFHDHEFTSKFSGNVIEICPVGALTNTDYRFKARPWDLQTKPSICTQCSNGCNVWFDYRAGKMVRINGRTNEAVNEEWTCDKGKFGHGFYNEPNRLTKPLLRKGDVLEECEWSEAYAAILEGFGGGKCAGLVGDLSNESLYAFKKLFEEQFGSDAIDFRWRRDLSVELNPKEAVQTRIAELETKKSLLVFGTPLSEELPILHLRVRKAWSRNGCKVVVAHWQPTDADEFADIVLRYFPGAAHTLARGLLAACAELGTISGVAGLPTVEDAAAHCGIEAQLIREAAKLLGADSAIITARSLFDVPHGSEVATSLQALAKGLGCGFNCYAMGANAQGAYELGLDSDNTHAILDGCAHGKYDALWLAGVDPFERSAEKAAILAAIERVPFLVVQAHSKSQIVNYASVVLPMTAPAEEDGTWTNCERRVQRIKQVLPACGDAKPAWKAFGETALAAKPCRPYFTAAEVLDAIKKDHVAFASVDEAGLAGEGSLLA